MDHSILFCLVVSFIITVGGFPQTEWTELTEDVGTSTGPIEKCPKGDDSVLDECLKQLVNSLTPLVGAGIDELGLEPLDPIEMKKFAYDRSLGPLNISVHLKNTIIHGYSNYKFLKLRVDSRNMKMKFAYEVPHILGQTNYKLGGNALFIPLSGGGPVKFEVFNMKAEGEIVGKIELNSEGKEVLQVEKINFKKLSIGDMNLVIRGLFDGNVLLSSVVHYVAKRYASQVFEVARPEVADFMGDYLANNILNPILKRKPYLVDYIPRNA